MEASFLDGKVRKWTLPLLEDRPQAEAPRLKRLRLAQGELAQFYDGDEGMRYLAFVELLPGRVRGNHYHARKQEWIYVLSGQVRLSLEEVCSKARATVELQTGDLAFIQTGVAHAIHTLQAGQAVEFSPVRFDPADVFSHALA